jgi:hypothetical protein
VIQRSPNHTRGRTPWAFSSSLRGVGALLEQRYAGLRDEMLPEEEWRVRAQSDLYASDCLGTVPIAGEVVRAHLKMYLGRSARRPPA